MSRPGSKDRHHEDEVVGGAHCAREADGSVHIQKQAYGKPAFQQIIERLNAPLPEDSAKRKEYPLFEGLFKYFPDALAEVAHVSFVSNQKHNPGQPLHWSREKSSDHLDCIARHLLEAGGIDHTNGGVRHSAQLAWRALANLQIEIEKSKGGK